MKRTTRKIGDTVYTLPLQWREYLGADVLELKKSVTARLVELGENPKTACRLKQSLLTDSGFAEWYDAEVQKKLWNTQTGLTRRSWSPEKKAAVIEKSVSKRMENRESWLDALRASKVKSSPILRLESLYAGDWKTFLGPDVINHKLSVTQYLSSPAFGPCAAKNACKYKHKLEQIPSYLEWYDPVMESKLSSHGTFFEKNFVAEYIRSLGFTCESRRFDWMGNKEIDCYIKELNIGFEVNGYLTHNSEWNPYGKSPKASSYHKAKSEACLAHGIKLYHIWHVANYPEEEATAKHIIDKALGIYTQRVFARKCKLEETTFADIRDFLDTYHMHGAIPANKYFKLTLNGETLQVMTFKRVTDATGTWELSRLATKHGVQVIGGSAKLFKHALPTLEGCKQLVSYAYRDFTPDPEDSVYTRLGFKFESFTQPGLSFYAPHPVEFPSGVVVNAGVYSRQKFQAHKLAATYGCKTQDLPYLGLYKTFDSGNLKFVYNL